MTLQDLAVGASATVAAVRQHGATDAIARRLRELGFIKGERIRKLATGPFGKEPVLVQIGYTRFALRGAEAARVEIGGLSDHD